MKIGDAPESLQPLLNDLDRHLNKWGIFEIFVDATPAEIANTINRDISLYREILQEEPALAFLSRWGIVLWGGRKFAVDKNLAAGEFNYLFSPWGTFRNYDLVSGLGASRETLKTIRTMMNVSSSKERERLLPGCDSFFGENCFLNAVLRYGLESKCLVFEGNQQGCYGSEGKLAEMTVNLLAPFSITPLVGITIYENDKFFWEFPDLLEGGELRAITHSGLIFEWPIEMAWIGKLDELPPPFLQALLAHEIGHHLNESSLPLIDKKEFPCPSEKEWVCDLFYEQMEADLLGTYLLYFSDVDPKWMLEIIRLGDELEGKDPEDGEVLSIHNQQRFENVANLLRRLVP